MNNVSHIIDTVKDWFSPDSLPITAAIISVIAALATLWVSVKTKQIAIKAYNQIEREDPWKLTPLYDNYWLIERIHPTVATIYGQWILPHGKALNAEQYKAVLSTRFESEGTLEVEYQDSKDLPYRYFLRGTKMVVKMPVTPIGSSFYLCYEEHKNIEQAKDRGTYTKNIRMDLVSNLLANKEKAKKTIYLKRQIDKLWKSYQRKTDKLEPEKYLEIWESPLYPTSL